LLEKILRILLRPTEQSATETVKGPPFTMRNQFHHTKEQPRNGTRKMAEKETVPK